MTESELISEADAAKQLRMSHDWLARQARAGNVPHVLLGNRRWYTQELIDRIVAEHTVESPSPSDVPIRRRRPPRRRPGTVSGVSTVDMPATGPAVDAERRMFLAAWRERER